MPRVSKAFEILVRENADMLTAYLRSVVCDPGTVDDLFQETMITAWKKLDECDLSRPFGPWLRGIAGRLVMAHYRRQKQSMMVCGDDVLPFVSAQLEHISSQPGDSWEEKIATLRKCIDALPGHYREAIETRYLREKPARQTATVLGVSLEALKKRLQRARRQIEDCLRRHQVLPEAQV